MPFRPVGEGIRKTANQEKDPKSTSGGTEKPGIRVLTIGAKELPYGASAHGTVTFLLYLSKDYVSQGDFWGKDVLPHTLHSLQGRVDFPAVASGATTVRKRAA